MIKKDHGEQPSFTVRKISYGEGVERVFPVMSPMIDSIKVVRRGKVRRAKLYYLRNLRGKSARIVEKKTDRPTEWRPFESLRREVERLFDALTLARDTGPARDRFRNRLMIPIVR